ncbi:heme exporter protein CcmD [Dongia sp.]|uniref:heme exporter protein CcmD n=1 Tax=Dongia sp. TaxID=1977262 RepID=UPI0035B01E34
MTDFGSFLAMGGYAAYVWPAYGAAIVILAAIWFDGQRRRRAVERALATLEQAALEAARRNEP